MGEQSKTIIQPAILCGGHGSRLWPLSTERRPKPFLPLVSRRSMLAETAARVAGETGEIAFAPVFAVGSARHETLLKAELPGAGLVLEPLARNSGPAIAAACLAAPDSLLLLLPADHHITDIDAFRAAIARGAPSAEDGALVTFGIKPDRPATGYGYICADFDTTGAPAAVERFVEKPDADTAAEYLASGRYAWNAGIFLARADALINAFETHAPEMIAAARAAMAETGLIRPGEVRRLDPAEFARAPSNSIDYAVMEKAEKVAVVPVDMGWSDIGDHGALYALKAATGHTHEGAVFTRDAERCFIRSEGPMVAVRGVSDLAVVATTRGVLVTPLADAGSTKPLAEDAAVRGFAGALSDQATQKVRDWLFETCLPLWAETAWDDKNGGFVESLGLSGAPEPDLPRRGRVAPRQIYAFAQAMMLGWDDPAAEKLVLDGLDYLDTRARAPGGGWASLLSPTGDALDPALALYDHAFIVLAGAWAYRATGETGARRLAEEALEIIAERMADPVHGGWWDTDARTGPRRSNPHMHLLEAALSLHRATGETSALDLALDIVELFETRFFDPRTGALTEYFEPDWTRAPGPAGRLSEPGHCYEWAVLLGFFEEAQGRDLISWRRRLIDFADRVGRDARGFAYDAVDLSANVLKPTRRLWPQLEMFRARLFHPETAPPGEAERVLETVWSEYLAAGPEGGWMDAFDAEGRPAASHVPASMLYHILTAFSPLCWR
ncbi:MAG: AGE family epimerase/isomerase [Oceanicaulis sp.]